MSAGKLAAQVSHASMAFLTNQMRKMLNFQINATLQMTVSNIKNVDI